MHCIVSCKLASVSHFGPGGEMRGRKCEVVVVVVVVVGSGGSRTRAVKLTSA